MTDLFLILVIVGTVLLIQLFFWFKKSKVDEKQSETIINLDRRISETIGQLREIGNNVGGTSRAITDQISSFAKETTHVHEALKRVQEEMKNISSFQEIFRSPKLRGQWGEASLGHILSQHFPSELYKSQYHFSSGVQVDAILKLPNRRILPIDAKFSSDNFERMIHTDSEDEKQLYRQKFLRDVKSRIDEIASKYILPSENTIDFALMYIPAEAIYYEIMFNLREEDIISYAQKRKVVLTSPNTIYLTLRTIEHWFRDTQISRHTREILKRLERVQKDSSKLSDDFRKLGRHLKDATFAYDRSEKRLSLLDQRVENLIEKKEVKQLENGTKKTEGVNLE